MLLKLGLNIRCAVFGLIAAIVAWQLSHNAFAISSFDPVRGCEIYHELLIAGRCLVILVVLACAILFRVRLFWPTIAIFLAYLVEIGSSVVIVIGPDLFEEKLLRNPLWEYERDNRGFWVFSLGYLVLTTLLGTVFPSHEQRIRLRDETDK